ncbi:MAG: UDP-N-acetylmuramate dehydrogenase [Patiriisocius sp.]|jgi:UDP-N-acetylmuramate dehydrogenase
MSITPEQNVSLAQYTTLQVGGVAEYFVTVMDEEELVEAVAYAAAHTLPVTVLGGGSNVLVSDAGVRGLVILNKIIGLDIEDDGKMVRLTSGAGEVFDDIVSEMVDVGVWGLENLSHIPGSVGATPVQNVGAYGVEVSDLIYSVRVYDMEAEMYIDLSNEACEFGYRDSLFKKSGGNRYVVASVTYSFDKTAGPILDYRDLQNRFKDAPTPQEVRDAIIEIRSAKFPNWKEVGTAGSFFKNPIIEQAHYEKLQETYPDLPGFPASEGFVKVPLGWILDKVLNLKGEGNEKVGTYQGQALVLINRGAATTEDIVVFANDILSKVKEITDIEVEWEVTRI